MTKWEYTYSDLTGGGSRDIDWGQLDRRGAEGWELVDISDRRRAIFKRPLAENVVEPDSNEATRLRTRWALEGRCVYCGGAHQMLGSVPGPVQHKDCCPLKAPTLPENHNLHYKDCDWPLCFGSYLSGRHPERDRWRTGEMVRQQALVDCPDCLVDLGRES